MSQSVERAARLLLYLSDRAVEHGEVDQGLKEIAAGTELDKATAYRIIRSLAKYGLVQQDELTSRYRLGAGAMRLGRAATDGHALLARCLPVMRSLAQQTGETVSLSERQELSSVTIHEIESRQVVRYANTIGRSVPLHVAAGARAILAFSDGDVIASALDTGLEPYTDLTICDRKHLEEVLTDVRRLGYATSFGERTSGVYSISAPVLVAHELAIGSVSILWPSRGKATDEQRLREWPDLLLAGIEPINDQYDTYVAKGA